MNALLALRRLTIATTANALLFGLSASALAGVITGTGTSPSLTQLGATDAVAMRLAPGQNGHALLTPYFTAQKGQMTVLHLVNTDRDHGKAIKLRLRGAANGDSLLAMTVLLLPGDTWTGAITAGPDGRAQITTTDKSCTAPQLASGIAQPLLTDRLNPALTPQERANHTREGTVEAILAADIVTAPRVDVPPLVRAIDLSFGGPRCNDPAVETALLQDIKDETTAASLGFATPSGGISGSWYIIDVAGATTFSAAMTALEAVNAADQPARGNYVLFPATETVVDAPERYTADPLLVSAGFAGREINTDGVLTQPTTAAVVQAQAHDLPDLSTPYRLSASPANAARTAAEASQALAAREVSNQFSVEPSISARTDWVFGLPTKRYSVAMDYATGLSTFSAVPPAGEGPQYFHTRNTQARDDRTCLLYSLFFSYTRDGYTDSPVRPASIIFCGAVTVVPINQLANPPTTSMLAASIALLPTPSGVSPPSTQPTGWSGLKIDGPAGLPVIGASFMKLVNPGAAPGLIGNYGLLYPHIVKRP
ncbi:surface layer protein NpdA [Acidovorax sp. SUPP3334]|uniref:surface layer protein NpdA n=1 Tax=Acidovorax sp. SUPP3334 TaxID=2920881 RepID=UPI0023DE5DE7|nr:surface layer protein NpdA [Acidovorax sp. SUPP3334]GKT26529.1 surface layer protein NpdA [Acidovorax sp. SUPP3334]